MRAGPQLGVAKAARAPPCTLPILAQAPTLRLSQVHTSMTLASAFLGCGRRFYSRSVCFYSKIKITPHFLRYFIYGKNRKYFWREIILRRFQECSFFSIPRARSTKSGEMWKISLSFSTRSSSGIRSIREPSLSRMTRFPFW